MRGVGRRVRRDVRMSDSVGVGWGEIMDIWDDGIATAG